MSSSHEDKQRTKVKKNISLTSCKIVTIINDKLKLTIKKILQ